MTVEELKDDNKEFIDQFINEFGKDVIFADLKDGKLRLITKDNKVYEATDKGIKKYDIDGKYNFSFYANSEYHISEEELRYIIEKFVTEPLEEKINSIDIELK